MMRPRGGALLTVAAWLLLMAQSAAAHLVSTGMGPVYDSMSHLLLSPEYLAPLLGLALWAGLRGADHGRWALFTASGAWLCGGLFGFALFPPSIATSLFTAGACLALGVLVAADLRTSVALTTVFAASIGFFDGAMNAAAEGPARSTAGVLGDCTAVFVLLALVASPIMPLRLLWLRVVIRVAGSWLAALGLLLIGWVIRARA
jgi:hypothetical protein